MRKLLLALVAVLTWCLPVFAQNVTNVSVMQEGNRIVVSYEIDKNSPEVGLTVSTDGGRTFSAPLTKVAGDVKNVQPGRRRIVWDVLAEMEKLTGDNIVFNVIAESENAHNGHEYVDLGLSVKWADSNLGASAPEENGEYYAFAELETKDDYRMETYKWAAPNEKGHYLYTKYNGQDDKFALQAAGLEIYCDGKQLVILDPEEKEAYIQDGTVVQGQVCPNCGEPLVFEEGCMHCRACGYSKCGG